MGAALGALRVIRSEGPGLMAKLLDNAAYLRQGFRDLGLRVVEPGTLPDGSEANTPVVPVLVGEDWQAVLLWKALFDSTPTSRCTRRCRPAARCFGPR